MATLAAAAIPRCMTPAGTRPPSADRSERPWSPRVCSTSRPRSESTPLPWRCCEPAVLAERSAPTARRSRSALAAAAGVQAALLARAGATVAPRAIHGPMGFEAVFGVSWPSRPRTRSSATAPGRFSATGSSCTRVAWVRIHRSIAPRRCVRTAAGSMGSRSKSSSIQLARQAAHLDLVDDGLSAKLLDSVSRCSHAHPRRRPACATLRRSIPASVSARARSRSRSTRPAAVRSGADRQRERTRLRAVSERTPARPATHVRAADKLADLAGDRLDGVFAERDAPATRRSARRHARPA